MPIAWVWCQSPRADRQPVSLRHNGSDRWIVSRSMRRPPLAQLSMQQSGVPGDHLVPHGIMPFDIADLGHALAVGRIVLPPKRQADRC